MALKDEIQKCSNFDECVVVLKQLEPRIGFFGGRKYVKAIGEKGSVPLRCLMEKIQSLSSDSNGEALESQRMVLKEVKRLNQKGNALLEECGWFKKLLTFIRRFFGNFGFRFDQVYDDLQEHYYGEEIDHIFKQEIENLKNGLKNPEIKQEKTTVPPKISKQFVQTFTRRFKDRRKLLEASFNEIDDIQVKLALIREIIKEFKDQSIYELIHFLYRLRWPTAEMKEEEIACVIEWWIVEMTGAFNINATKHVDFAPPHPGLKAKYFKLDLSIFERPDKAPSLEISRLVAHGIHRVLQGAGRIFVEHIRTLQAYGGALEIHFSDQNPLIEEVLSTLFSRLGQSPIPALVEMVITIEDAGSGYTYQREDKRALHHFFSIQPHLCRFKINNKIFKKGAEFLRSRRNINLRRELEGAFILQGTVVE